MTNDTIKVGDITHASGVAIGMGATAVHVSSLGDVNGDVVTGTKVTLVNEAPKERVAARFQVSPPPQDYFPREVQEKKLAALLTNKSRGYDGFRTVFLYGPPGVGRSWLARQVATMPEVVAAFPDGILFADLGATEIRTAVWNFIEPFDMITKQTSLNNPTEMTAAMEKALGDKSVLIVIDSLEQWRRNWQELRNWLPYTCTHCVVLLIVPQLPGLLDADRELAFPTAGLTKEEATQFLINRLEKNADGSAKCNVETMRSLAEAMAFSPKAMAAAVQDINTRRVNPEEYLTALRTGTLRGGGVALLWPELDENFENLPPEGQALLPYLGMLTPWPWAAEDLMGVSLCTGREFEIGLSQLEQYHMVDIVSDNPDPDQTIDTPKDAGVKVRYQTPAILKDFALNKLAEVHGEQLYKASMALRASNMLRTAELVLRYARQSALAQAWADTTIRPGMMNSVKKQFDGKLTGTISESKQPNLMALAIDPLEAFFEDVVLTKQSHQRNWLALMQQVDFENLRKQLEVIFDWALAREDWKLIYRFANRLGANTSFIIDDELNPNNDGRNWERFGFAFALLKRITARDVEVRDLILKGSLVKDTEWTKCNFVANSWPGTNVIGSTFTDNDMVGFSLPAGVITGCTFTNVDARFADFRGTIFQQCKFERVKFTSARLENAKFIDCYFDLETVDFRMTAWEENFEAIRIEQKKKLEAGNY